MTDELHVSSLIVQARPEAIDEVARAIERIPGAEIHQRIGGIKLIVTLETAHAGEIMQHLDAINASRGVLSAALVYHHWEPVGESESDHESHAPQLSQG